MAFDKDIFLASFLDQFSSGIQQRQQEARAYKERQEAAAERNMQLIQQRQMRAKQAASLGRQAMQLGATQEQVRTAMSSGITGIQTFYDKLQTAASQKGMKKLGSDDIAAIIEMPNIPGIVDTLEDKTLDQFAMESYGAVGKAAPQEDRGGFFASFLDPRGRVKQQLRETDAGGGMSIADVNAAARQAEYQSLFPQSTITYTDIDYFTSEKAYEFSTKMADIADDAVKTDAAQAYIAAARRDGTTPEESRQLEAAARKEIVEKALEPYIEYYGDTYQHGGFFENKLVKRQVEDLMGKDWWDDFSSAYAQQSPESEDSEGEADQTSEALGMTPMPENEPVITLPPQDVKFEEAEALPEETIALVEESMSDELKQGYTAKYTRAQWDDMTRKERRERGLPESTLGAMGFAFRDDIDELPAVKNAAIMRNMNKDKYKIRIRGRGVYHVTKEQLESMTRGAFLAGEPAVEIMEYDEGEKKAKNIPSTLLKRYQVGE
jgi:hypothetical protein